MKSSALSPEDDLLLPNSIEAGVLRESLSKENVKIPEKRKGRSLSLQYYRTRKRIRSKSVDSPGLCFFDRCSNFQDHVTVNHEAEVGDAMFSDCLASNLGGISTTDLVNKSTDGCHESGQNDYINGSMGEDGLYKVTENIDQLLTDNRRDFFDPGIELKDDTHMHKGDSDNSSAVTEVEYSSLPDSLMSFSDEDYSLCILSTEDTIDDIPNSQLLDFPEDDLENSSSSDDQQDGCHWEADVESTSISRVDSVPLTCILNTEDPEIPCVDSIFLVSHPSPSVGPQKDSTDVASSFTESQTDGPDLSSELSENDLEDSSSSGDQEDVYHWEADVESTSISNFDSVQHSCILNTEDLEIPCNDHILLLVYPPPSVIPLTKTATDSIDATSPFTQSQIDGPDLFSEFDSTNPHAVYTLKFVSMDCNPSISDHNNSDSDSDLHRVPDIEDPEVRCIDSVFLRRHPSPSVTPQTDTDSITDCDPDFSSEFDAAYPHVGSYLKTVSMDRDDSISAHNNLDSKNDLRCLPSIEKQEISCNDKLLRVHQSPSVRPQTDTDCIDLASSFTQSQMDGLDLSSEFDSAYPHVGYNLKTVSTDHDDSISDHNNLDSGSDLPCLPDIVNPEIPCNDNRLLLIHESPSVRTQIATDSIDPAPSFTRLQMDCTGLSSEFDSACPHVSNNLKTVSTDRDDSISDHNNLDSGSSLLCLPDIENPEIPCNDNRLLPVYESPSVRTIIATDSIDPEPSFTPLQMDDPDLSFEFDSAHPHARNTCKSVSMDHNPSISDHNNSDCENDLPCFPDIEALIRKLDSEYAQESWITNEVKRHKYEHSKWTINRQEQSLQRSMSSLGAFAIFSSGHFNYYIKKTEVTIGRSTDGSTEVDIDLRKESHANMISRKQATIKMDMDGTFTLKNIGKGSILMKGESISHGQVAALGSSCIIQIRGMNFMFEVNDRYVRWYLDSIIKKTQGKFTTFEWSASSSAGEH